MLAIACGPTVSLWDHSKLSKSQVGHESLDTNDALTSFSPHGISGSISDLAWNHNGQILATCFQSTLTDDTDSYDVVLSHAGRKTRLEAFRNNTSGQGGPTSIGFGGKAAKSRYICVSDSNGSVAMWDMKKSARVRQFTIPAPAENTTVGCVRALMDPSDTYVAALGTLPFLSIFRLREADLVLHFHLGEDGQPEQGANCFQYSHFDPQRLVTGKRNGTTFVWDVSHSLASSEDTVCRPTFDKMNYVHKKPVSEVSFSPIHRALLATSSWDKHLAFHDIKTHKTVQVLSPTEDSSGITTFAFDSAGILCATGSENGIVRLYDLRKLTAGPLATTQVTSPSNPGVKKVQFAPSMPKTNLLQEDGPTLKNKDEDKGMVSTKTPQRANKRLEDEAMKESIIRTSITVPSSTAMDAQNEESNKATQESSQSSQSSPSSNQIQAADKAIMTLYSTQRQKLNKILANMNPVSSTVGESAVHKAKVTEEGEGEDDDSKEIVELVSLPIKKEVPTSLIPISLQTNQYPDIGVVGSAISERVMHSVDDSLLLTREQVDNRIDDAIDALRDDVEESIRTLHSEFLRKMYFQETQIFSLVNELQTTLMALKNDNDALREENERLRRS